jgi:subtilisin family serine protease
MKRRCYMFRTGFLQIIMVCVSTLTAIAAPPDQAAGPPNRYIAQVADGFEPGQVGRGVAQRTGGKLVHVYTSAVKGFSIHLPPGLAKKDIESQSGVLMVEPDVEVYAIAQILPTGVDRIEADNSGVTAAVDVDIAIIDTGIDVDHPDLNVVGGRHFYSIWGFISFEDDEYDDDNGHGSHCAGIAAALNNDIGVVGVAPGARLWAVKVLDSSGSGYLSDVIAGVDWVTARSSTIEVANMSLAAIANSGIFRTAVQNSVNAGIFYAVAAGNDSTDVYGYDGIFGTGDDVIPAAYPEAAAVSAMVDLDGQPGGGGGSVGYGSDDSFASFSNYSASVVAGNPVDSPGKAIDLLMPGVNIYSCYMNGGYATGSGTSMASPHAAGLAALYIAANGRANDAGGVNVIRQALIDTGVAQTDPALGLAELNDPDGNMENIGWAGSSQTEPPALESILVTPVSASIQVGQTQQYTATAIYSNGSEKDVTGQAAWFSSNSSVATINSGLALGVSPGNTDITAVYSDLSSNVATLTVTEPTPVTLESITVTPATAQIIVGGKQQYTATGTYSDDTTEDITAEVLWASSASSIATIDSFGLATGIAEGTAAITAELSGVISDGVTLAVMPAPAPSQVAHVLIDVSPLSLFRRAWDAIAIIVVVDDNGWPIGPATIEGAWSGVYKKKVSGPLETGTAIFESGWIRKAGTVTFTINKIIGSDGQEYILDPPEPHDSATGP